MRWCWIGTKRVFKISAILMGTDRIAHLQLFHTPVEPERSPAHPSTDRPTSTDRQPASSKAPTSADESDDRRVVPMRSSCTPDVCTSPTRIAARSRSYHGFGGDGRVVERSMVLVDRYRRSLSKSRMDRSIGNCGQSWSSSEAF